MSQIKTTCPSCGDVTVAAHRIYLRLRPGARESEFWFTCPDCSTPVTKPASEDTTALLLNAGVERIGGSGGDRQDDLANVTSTIATPDRSPDPDAPALTLDDLIEFHFALLDEVTLEDLFAAER